MSDDKGKKARFRTVKTLRLIDPRTGKETGEVQTDSLGEPAPELMRPDAAAALYHADAWYSAACDAICAAVGAAQIHPEFQGQTVDEESDPKIIAAMKAFLATPPDTGETAAERLTNLALDYLAGKACIEIRRGVNGMPSAWYHVPAATVRLRRDGSYAQVTRSGRLVAKFQPYKGAKPQDTAASEMVVIRRYDPTALYVGSPMGTPILTALDRLALQDSANAKQLGKGNLPAWLLLLQETLDDDDYQRMNEWSKQLANGGTDEQIGVLDGVGEHHEAVKLQDNADVAYAKGEELLRARVLGKMRVPPTKVALGAANYATAYQEDANFKAEVVGPILEILTSRLTWVVREFAPEGYKFAYRMASLEDWNALVQSVNALLEKGVYTMNMALQKLGYPGIGPAGDVRIAFTNQGPVKYDDLASGNVPPTPGRIVDSLLSLRRAIEEARRAEEAPK